MRLLLILACLPVYAADIAVLQTGARLRAAKLTPSKYDKVRKAVATWSR